MLPLGESVEVVGVVDGDDVGVVDDGLPIELDPVEPKLLVLDGVLLKLLVLL